MTDPRSSSRLSPASGSPSAPPEEPTSLAGSALAISDERYRDCLAGLAARLNYERQSMGRTTADLRLGKIRRVLKALGDPQSSAPIIHVAGTKGKGSTASLIAAALTASGRRTGLYTSPHLHRLEERFQIDGEPVSPSELTETYEQIAPALEWADRHQIARGDQALTFFDATTTLGFQHFANRRVDAIVLEVGLGGRLDSTNVARPELAVLTSISFDHMKQLGNTLGAIAGEKAGILKRQGRAVSGVRGDEARAAIHAVAQRRGVLLREIDTDFFFSYVPPSPPLTTPEAGEATVRTWRTDWGRFPLPFFGEHQAWNVAIALAAIDQLNERGWNITREQVFGSWTHARWPARVEIVSQSPWLVIDGAHNAASALALAQTLRTCFPPGERTIVFGTTRDKDLPGQIRALAPIATRWIATRYLENPRAVPIAELIQAIEQETGKNPGSAESPGEALRLARAQTNPAGLIVVTGSLFLAAEVRAAALGLENLVLPALSAFTP